MKSVAVIIPHLNHRELLVQCFDSIVAQTHRPDLVVVVDNGSRDGSDEVMHTYTSRLPLHSIELGRNTGFAYAVNRGIEHAISNGIEYVMVLNNDTRLEVGCIERLVERMNSCDADTAVVQPLILNANSPQRIDSAGIAIASDMSAINYRQGEHYDTLETGCKEIFGATGCAALFSSEALRAIHRIHGDYFDEAYFAYYEDVDLSWRLRYLGYRAWCDYDAVVYHVHSATGKSYSPFKSFYVHRNHLFNIIKNTPMQTIPEVVIRMVIRYVLLVSSVVLGRGPAHRLHQNSGGLTMVSIVMKAWWQVIKRFPQLLIKRRKVVATKKVSLKTVKKWMTAFRAPVSSTVYSEHS